MKEKEDLKTAITALENISDPIGYMKKSLKEGESLDGMYAIKISERPQFYQDIARNALEIIKSKPVPYPTFAHQLYDHMYNEHGLILLENELDEIIRIVKNMKI